VCIPYAVKFDRARAYGNVVVNYAATVNGTLNYTYNWEAELASSATRQAFISLGMSRLMLGRLA
jgi:hypothetical protein